MVGQRELGERGGDETDDLVARLVAPCVVERLEMIDVAQQQAKVGPLAISFFLAQAQRLVDALAANLIDAMRGMPV